MSEVATQRLIVVHDSRSVYLRGVILRLAPDAVWEIPDEQIREAELITLVGKGKDLSVSAPLLFERVCCTETLLFAVFGSAIVPSVVYHVLHHVHAAFFLPVPHRSFERAVRYWKSFSPPAPRLIDLVREYKWPYMAFASGVPPMIVEIASQHPTLTDREKFQKRGNRS